MTDLATHELGLYDAMEFIMKPSREYLTDFKMVMAESIMHCK